MDVSVIIVNYKTSKLVVDCINTIIEHTTGLSYEIIVVDNDSKDDIDEVIQRNFSSKVNVLLLPENIGFGKANNEGMKIATGRNILFLNPDTLILGPAIMVLSQFLDSHNQVGACGGNLLDWEMKPAISFRRIFPGALWSLSELTFYKLESLIYRRNWMYNFSNVPISVAYISGADLMVKSSVLNAVGGFCPDFFMYYEETDLCYRISHTSQKWKIYSVPEAQIQHLEGKSFVTDPSKKVSKVGLSYSEKSRNIYYHRNVNAFGRLVARCLYPLHLKLGTILF